MREVRSADASALAALHALCFGGEAWSEAAFASSLSLETTRGFVEEDETLRGFVLAQQAGPEVEILTLCVHSGERRRGIGAALVKQVLALPGAEVVFLEVASGNEAARKLYEACGFEPFASRAGYYGSTDAVNYRYTKQRLNGTAL